MYVGDLDFSCTKQNLIEHFKKRFHSVVDAKIITDQTTNISRGYGFVMFSNKEDSSKALAEMNGTLIKGKPIRVSQGKMNQNSQHGKSGSQSQTQQAASQIYGMGMYNGQSIPPGTMLGGLGVQFKPEGMPHPLLGMQPQSYTILPGGTLLSPRPVRLPDGAAHAPHAAAADAPQLPQHHQQGQRRRQPRRRHEYAHACRPRDAGALPHVWSRWDA